MFSPSTASRETLITLTGWSLATTTGVFIFSGSSGAYANIISTGNNRVTFYPQTNLSNFLGSGIRSGQIRIHNKYGSATETNWLTFADPIFVSGFVPQSGLTGTAIRITGSGIRDATGLYFIQGRDEYTGVLDAAIQESNTWIRTGYVPFVSGGLNAYVNVKLVGDGGSHKASQTFFIREQGGSLSGLSDFPTPYIAENYLRVNNTASALEYRTPSQVLSDISGFAISGGRITGEVTITGGSLNTTGIKLLTTGTTTGHFIITNLQSGGYLIGLGKVGGLDWVFYSYKLIV